MTVAAVLERILQGTYTRDDVLWLKREILRLRLESAGRLVLSQAWEEVATILREREMAELSVAEQAELAAAESAE